jgi:hypothetical protein
MRCPGCRQAIDFDAVEHACGWRVSRLMQADQAIREAERPQSPPAKREVVDAHLAKIRGIVSAKTIAPPALNDRMLRRVPMLADVGHGDKCTCELCSRSRGFGPPGERVKPTKLERLRALFPLEGAR